MSMGHPQGREAGICTRERQGMEEDRKGQILEALTAQQTQFYRHGGHSRIQSRGVTC